MEQQGERSPGGTSLPESLHFDIAERWKRLFEETKAGFQVASAVNKDIRTMVQEYEESTDLTLEEEIKWLRSVVAIKEDQFLDLELKGKELTSNCVILMNNSTAIVSHLCGIVQELMANVDLFQRKLKGSNTTRPCQSPLCTHLNKPKQGSGGLLDLGSCVEEFLKVTKSANSGLAKASRDWEESQETARMLKANASRDWEESQETARMLKAKAAKSIVGKILGKKKKKKTVKPKNTTPDTPTQKRNTANPGDFEPVNFPINPRTPAEEQNADKGPGAFRVDFPRDFRIMFDPLETEPNRKFKSMPVPEPAEKPTPDQEVQSPDSMEMANKTPDNDNPEGPSNDGNLDPGSHAGCSSSSEKRNESNDL